jgi:hypothetical protein
MYVLPKEKEAHAMRANYSMTGTERRDLVHAIERITGEKAEYQFVPTCAYEIGNITVDKEGTLICEDEEKLGRVMVGLGQMGYYPDAEQPADPEPTEVPETKEAAEPETDSEATPTDEQDAETEPATEPETDSETTDPAEPKEPAENTEKAPELTISLPLAAANVGTLTNILSSKGNLIRHALGVTDIRINVTRTRSNSPGLPGKLPQRKPSLHPFHQPSLQALEGTEARQQQTGGNGQREIRLPLLPSPPRIYRTGLQGSKKDPASEPDRQRSLPERSSGKDRRAEGGGRMRSMFPSEDIVKNLREHYPAGTRVELLQMDDPQAPPIGTKGTVIGSG